MSNDPNNLDPTSKSPKSTNPAPADHQKKAKGEPDDEVFDLLEFEGIQVEPLAEAAPPDEAVESPETTLPAPASSVSFDMPRDRKSVV